MLRLPRIKALFFLLFAISQIVEANDDSKHHTQIVNGILIEGMDCSGKSTICELLDQTLKKKFNTKFNYIFLSDNIIVRFLLDKALSHEGTEDSDLFYASGATT